MNLPRSRAVVGAAVAAVSVVALSACSKVDAAGPAAAADIKIGIITDMSGPTVANQLPWLHGMQARVKTTNDAGGVKGKQIKLIVEDDKFDAALGLAAYKRLVNQENVVALSGFGATDTQAAVEPFLEKDGAPIIGGQTVSLNLSEPQHDHFFAVAPSYRQQANTIVGIIRKETGKSKPRVAEIDSGITSGVQFKNFINGHDGKGIELAGNFVLPANSTSADAIIQKVIAAKPDYIAFHGSANSLNATLKSQQKFGSRIPMLGVAATGTPAVWVGIDEPVGNLFRFVQGVTPAPIQAPGTAAMVAAAKALGHEDEAKDPSFVTGYISGIVLVAGLEKAGDSVTRESLTGALGSLSSIDTGGLTGALGYGSKDRVGMDVLRPYGWDYATKSFKPGGEYSDYENLPVE